MLFSSLKGLKILLGTILVGLLGGAVPVAAQDDTQPGLTIYNAEDGWEPLYNYTYWGQKLAGENVSSSFFEGNCGLNCGNFYGGSDIIGFDQGLIISTGKVKDIAGPNDQTGKSTDFWKGSTSIDPFLAKISGPGVRHTDVEWLEFNFVPKYNTVSLDYVFASEAYNELVNQPNNDVFGIFINGEPASLVPGTNVPVGINTVNGGNPIGTNASHPEWFINNEQGENGANLNTQMDGLTRVMTLTAFVNAGENNKIRIAIADVGDGMLDSSVFIKFGSLRSFPSVQPGPGKISFARVGTPFEIDEKDGVVQDIIVKRLGGGQGTVSVDVYASGTAILDKDFRLEPQTLTFTEGETEKIVKIIVINDTEDEREELFTLKLVNPTGGAVIEGQSEILFKLIDEPEDHRYRIGLMSAAYTVKESDKVVRLPVWGDYPSNVWYCTCNETAVAGQDYVAKSGRLFFSEDSVDPTIEIPIIDDDVPEGTETFKVKLYNPSTRAALVAPYEAIVTIIDDDE
ncbi:choice-of-anchor L domain-containing protein [Paenibacillus flagellatus]|uniref:Calx-beta domain-containing protein n=1 Tax=Paenibacillus flagellatus TaxID=2211139 RepID=A0A2V5KC81_9BACL|nr:choice-of-anchor L domain-containing protein [Paenibacillus flagellatus]PYI57209.1 hypothetical protein DLM86_01845 [Paenibacillus flagellatus]